VKVRRSKYVHNLTGQVRESGLRTMNRSAHSHLKSCGAEAYEHGVGTKERVPLSVRLSSPG
jgi:hypothetical protein